MSASPSAEHRAGAARGTTHGAPPPPRARPRAAAELLLACAALLLGGWVIGALVTNAHPAWDAPVAARIRGDPQSALTGLMRAITWVGSPLPLDVVFAAGLAILLLRRRRPDALFLTLASPGTVLLVQIIKRAVGRTRPLGPFILLSAVLASIGLSRVYVGVHYPTDVIAAWLLVAGWLTILHRALGCSDRSAANSTPHGLVKRTPWRSLRGYERFDRRGPA